MTRESSSLRSTSVPPTTIGGFDENEPITEITPALTRAVADMVYARLLADITLDQERRRGLRPAQAIPGVRR
jgi:hypothetical protein